MLILRLSRHSVYGPWIVSFALHSMQWSCKYVEHSATFDPAKIKSLQNTLKLAILQPDVSVI